MCENRQAGRAITATRLDYATACAFRFLRQPSRPKPPRPEANGEVLQRQYKCRGPADYSASTNCHPRSLESSKVFRLKGTVPIQTVAPPEPSPMTTPASLMPKAIP